MNAEEKFALERDAFERKALGLPPREFANADEKQQFAREILAREAAKETEQHRREAEYGEPFGSGGEFPAT